MPPSTVIYALSIADLIYFAPGPIGICLRGASSLAWFYAA
jgi:hypothetical protein